MAFITILYCQSFLTLVHFVIIKKKKKDGLECDGKRPCSGCISRNSPHMCMGLELEQHSINRMKEKKWQSNFNIAENPQRKRKKRCMFFLITLTVYLLKIPLY